MDQTDYTKGIFYISLFFAFVVGLAMLKLTAAFFIPLTISILLSFVFYPFVKKLADFHIPWILGILIVIILALASFSIIGNLLVTSIKAILAAYPKYEARFTSLYSTLANTFHLPFDEQSSLFANMWNSLGIRSFIQDFAFSLSNLLISGAKVLLLISLFIVFLLIEMRGMKEKVKNAFREERLSRMIIFITIKTIAEVTHFFSIKFVISLITGILVGLTSLAFRLDFAIIWGFLAFILNFIPNFGSITSFALTTIFAILQFYPDPARIILLALCILVINTVLGNIIEPRWEGGDLGISPFIILVSLSLWGWLWGFVGMILAVPMTVTIKIVCDNIRILKPVGALLGHTRKNRHR
ncbi:MAG: AI-2E family transporter [Treponema sp.]|nr:AI-2E family transporter [Treponema sp.]